MYFQHHLTFHIFEKKFKVSKFTEKIMNKKIGVYMISDFVFVKFLLNQKKCFHEEFSPTFEVTILFTTRRNAL